MSNRKKPSLPPPPKPMPKVEYLFADQYQYTTRGDLGVIHVAFSTCENWHSGITLPIALAISLHQQLGNTLAQAIRAAAGVPEPPPLDAKNLPPEAKAEWEKPTKEGDIKPVAEKPNE